MSLIQPRQRRVVPWLVLSACAALALGAIVVAGRVLSSVVARFDYSPAERLTESPREADRGAIPVTASARGPHAAASGFPSPRCRSVMRLDEDQQFQWIVLDGNDSELILMDRVDEGIVIRRVRARDGVEIWKSRYPGTVVSQHVDGKPMSTSKPLLPGQRGTDRVFGKIVQPAPDLNRDGTGDVILYSPAGRGGSMIAVSGANGELMWDAAKSDGGFTTIASAPLVTDVDGDGGDDIAVCVYGKEGVIWLESIDGRDGRRRWRCPVDQHGGQAVAFAKGALQAPSAISLYQTVHEGRNVIAVEGDQTLQYHDLATGRLLAESHLPIGTRLGTTIFADLNSDGHSEAVLMRRHGTRELVAGLPPFTISAWQPRQRQCLWIKTLSCAVINPSCIDPNSFVDLNRDQQIELPFANYVNSVLSIDVIDAMSGASIWPESHRLSRNADATVGPIVGHPDFDGDGIDELLVVSIDQAKRGQRRLALYLDLLSGANGDSLLTMFRPLSATLSRRVLDVKVVTYADGRSRVMVVTGCADANGWSAAILGKTVDVWSLVDREVICTLPGVSHAQVLDRDGGRTSVIGLSRNEFSGTALMTIDLEPRSAAEVTSSESKQMDSDWRPLVQGRNPSSEVGKGHDPRWLEPLPWAPLVDRTMASLVKDVASPGFLQIDFITVALLTFLGVFVAPSWLVVSSLSRGQWSLARWLMFPASIGIAIALTSLLRSHEQTEVIVKATGLSAVGITFVAPLACWTVLLFPIQIIGLILRRHYTRVVALLGFATLLSVLVALIWLLPVWTRMDDDFRFDLDRWYWIWLVAAYVTGWAYLFVTTLHVCSGGTVPGGNDRGEIGNDRGDHRRGALW